ncbi:MAG: 6,7-dimethyl-8-ribityllumazine synthase [Deltaproteobacteria bacterium]|nr:6,7-dimethyl-8-ribityllumazine synthase [Deltaproteobacteria bacterium]
MVTVIEGKLEAQGLRIGIIVSRFNSFVTDKLLTGALEALESHGGEEESIEIVRVPGAFEIPLAARKMAASGRYDALVCLGAVIRGDTPHFEYIAAEAARGIGNAMMTFTIPIAFGVLTTNNVEQALERAGSGKGNKGFEAALTAVEMANLTREIP